MFKTFINVMQCIFIKRVALNVLMFNICMKLHMFTCRLCPSFRIRQKQSNTSIEHEHTHNV